MSLWQNGELVGSIMSPYRRYRILRQQTRGRCWLDGAVREFFPMGTHTSAQRQGTRPIDGAPCRLFRDEVTEQLVAKQAALTALETDWKKLLFPEATDEKFADGYAQAVTFGLLMARAKNIKLSTGLQQVATTLSQTSSLIGAALRFLTDSTENQAHAENFPRYFDRACWMP